MTIKLRKVFSRANTTPGSGCVRCKMFKEKVKSRHPLAEREAAEFYCDVGMKAVLRNIRRYMLKTMSLPRGRIDNVDQSILHQECIRYFKLNVLSSTSQLEGRIIRNRTKNKT